ITIFLSILFVGFYAISDEFHQLFVPGRSGEMRDVLIDTTAGALAVCILYFIGTSKKLTDFYKILKKFIISKFKDALCMRRTGKIVALILAVTFAFMAIAAFTSQVIPGKYLGIGFILSALVTAAVVYTQFKPTIRLKTSIILTAISVVMIIGNIGIITAGVMTNSFLNSIQDSPQSYEEYSIVALKSRAIKLDTPNQKIGLLKNENKLSDVKDEAKKKTPATQNEYDNPSSMMVSLQDNTIHMAVLKSSYLKLLQETNNNELFGQLEVLATFKVKADQAGVAPSIDMSKPFIIYISGIDTYGAISTTSRSDVNILAVVNPVTHKILLVNTPRDYYVQLHGTTGLKDKLTHAGLYGIDMSVATMEDLYGVDINYNIRINFSSLEKIVDTLGGVEVQSEYAFTAEGNNYKVGKNYLNGAQALAFSRERHSFEAGDRTRGQNQQRVIQGIINKMSTPSSIVNYQKVLAVMQDSFQTNMSSADIATLFRNQLDSMAKWNVTSTIVDGTGASDYTYSMGRQKLYVMIPDPISVQSAKNAIQSTLGQ
ncbi:MAG: hypothetical protein JWN28_684, partial [Candidatus Saccharibacteria bacterium]|nr:hypothetical protein [Candidatus Saccharibacteria bacterium]